MSNITTVLCDGAAIEYYYNNWGCEYTVAAMAKRIFFQLFRKPY